MTVIPFVESPILSNSLLEVVFSSFLLRLKYGGSRGDGRLIEGLLR